MSVATQSRTDNIRGLDSIRFLAALWVVFSHLGHLPIFTSKPDRSDTLRYLVGAAEGTIFNGPAAVIVFFVISGFCIHFPFASGRAFHLREFLTRRYVRIGLPLVASVALSPLAGLPLTLLGRMAMWSLFSELLYYTAYPLLRKALAYVCWPTLLPAAFMLALAVALFDYEHASRSVYNSSWGDYPLFGVLGNALLGLPCWLLGLRLAEWCAATATRPRPRPRHIWIWRMGIWGASSLALVLRFHSPLGYPWTLNLFGIAVYFWLQREIAHYRTSQPLALLESAGAWSYSLYLIHPLTQAYFASSLVAMFGGGIRLQWCVLMALTLGSSYLFFWTAERPAHLLARSLAGWKPLRASTP